MNKLLNPISWSAYLETIAILAIAYYAYIGWKYYRPEISKLISRLSGKENTGRELPAAPQYQGEESGEPQPVAPATAPQPDGQSHEQVLDDNLSEEAYELGEHLNFYIQEATGKPFAPGLLISRLKKILHDFPGIAATTNRDKINSLIVRECEKTGTALLSESEVDLWWSA